MAKMSDFLLVGTTNLRTYFYLSLLKSYHIKLSHVFIYQGVEFELEQYKGNEISLLGYSVNMQASFNELCVYHQAKFVDYASINEMNDMLSPYADKYILFSGKGIVNATLTENFSLIHVHPGKLPQYRGSTTLYYSLLKDNNITASAFFMAKGIDTGDVISEVTVGITDILKYDLDYLVDPMLRAIVLVRLLLSYEKQGKVSSKKQQNQKEKSYYKIHPVLRHIVQRKTKNI